MKTCITMKHGFAESLPQGMAGPDIRFPAELVRRLLEEFTKPGDVVFDPFAGYGTTLIAAEAMGRVPFGVEINPVRREYARSRLKYPERLFEGDARKLSTLPVPPFTVTAWYSADRLN